MIRFMSRTVKRILVSEVSHDSAFPDCDSRYNTKRTNAYTMSIQPSRRPLPPATTTPDKTNQSPNPKSKIEKPHCQRLNTAIVLPQKPPLSLNWTPTPRPPIRMSYH